MALAVADVWKLLVQSGLLTQEQCQQLNDRFAAIPGAATAPGKSLAEWLVRQNVVSKYQALILLAGRSGPFFYGDYKIYDRIDAGRLAGTFRAVHSPTNHPVMLRFLAGPATQSAQIWAEMQRWIPLTAHPQVARCYDAVDLGSYKFLVLEDLRGHSLQEVLDKKKRLPADEACRLARLAAQGLTRLHENGRVHGDIRPHNLWLEQSGNLKLLLEPEVGTREFNVINAPSEPDGLARADYAAPEFLQAGRVPDPLVDIYALGCSLYQSLSGQVPFPNGDVNNKLQRHATEAIKPLDFVGAPTKLTQMVAYCMAKNPAVRFQQANIVAEQLVQFIGAAQQNLKPTTPPASQPKFELAIQHHQAAATNAPSMPFGPEGSNAPGRFAGPNKQIEMPTPISVSPVASAPAIDPIAVAGKGSAISIAHKRRARTKKRNNLIFLAMSLLATAGAVAAVYFFVLANRASVANPSEGQEPGQPRNTTTAFVPPSTGMNKNPPGESAVPEKIEAVVGAENGKAANATNAVVADDGQTLWASPTTGQPIQLKYVPPGAQLFLVARPAALLETPEGERVLKALGPQFDAGRKAWEAEAGVSLNEVEQLIVALYGNQGKPPKAAYVVRLKSEVESDALAAKWGQVTAVEGLTRVLQKGETGYYLPPDDKHTFVIGPLDPELRDAAAAGWKPPLLRREIGQLLQVSDDQRHLTLLFAPNFLFGDGQELFAGDLARGMKPLEWFLGDGLKSALVSLHLADHFYFEMRMESDIQTDRFQLAKHVRERMEEIPNRIESYMAELNPHPYWRLIAFRYPSMIRFLHQHTRIGVDGSHAMLNAVLPSQAAHNLVFGGEMALASTPGVAIASTAGNKSAGPKTLDETLNAKISIGFAQDSLEFSMQNIVMEVKAAYPELPFEFRIKILGTDLEKDGITRNQQIRDFNQKDKPVNEVLTAMVMKANPVTTVKAPTEIDQKLIWVVGPDPDKATEQIILITTRNAAAQKKYTMPEVFRPK